MSAKGVFIVARGGKDWAVPQPLLKLPAKKGDTWEFDPFPAANRPAGLAVPTTTYTVGEEAEVEVPAGKFKAVPVESKQVAAGGGFAATQWYAPGVGVVKTVMKVGGRERTTVLKSFTPAK